MSGTSARPGPRVIVVTSRLDIGGTERHLTRILPALQARGLDISLYVLERGGQLETELLSHGVRVASPRTGGSKFLSLVMATIDLARFLRRERPDIVHYYLPRPYLVGSVAAELAGQRRRIMSRRSLATYRQRHPLLARFENWLHRRTSVLLGNSTAVVAQLANEAGNWRKVGLIHNGIALPDSVTKSQREAARQIFGLAENACAIAVVANLMPYKGHDNLLDALACIRDEIQQPWVLLVAGRDSGIGDALKLRAHELRLSANIQWLGECEDVEQLLHAADLVVMASHEEGFSNALLEAMAHGIATVATTVGGNTDAIVGEESGLLVPSRSPEAMGAAILRLISSAELRKRLGAAARRRIAQHYSLELCVARYERLYRHSADFSFRPISDILDDSDGESEWPSGQAASVPSS